MSDPSKGSVGAGVGIALGLHLLQFAMIPAAAALGSIANSAPHQPYTGLSAVFLLIAFWSVTQFLYLGPAAWIAKSNGRTETMKGILIVAAVGILINGACDSVFLLHH
jgi:hypothetical protein